MDDSTLTVVGLVVGIGLLYLGARIRSKAHQRARERKPPEGP